MPNDLESAWSDLHDATPAGWFVGQPSYSERFHGEGRLPVRELRKAIIRLW